MTNVSVIVIAHNEGGNIRACLDSIRQQTLKPDEVILVAHNCTDDTVKIAKEFSEVKIVELSGPAGPVFARARGFEKAKGEIVAFMDGDSYALTNNWLRRLIFLLSDLEILAAGGGVWVTGGLRPILMGLDFFWLKPIYVPILKFFRISKYSRESEIEWHYFWGANFAIRKSVYEKIGGLGPLIQLRQKIGLSFDAEDLYLALKVSRLGKVGIDPWAVIVSRAAKVNWKKRIPEHGRDKEKLVNYLNSTQGSL